MNPGLVMRNIIPVVMAGVLGIYGLIVAVIIQGSIDEPQNGLSVQSIHWICSSCCWSLLWSFWTCCRYGNWNCGLCRCPCRRTAGKAFCRYDFDLDFR